MESPAKSIGRTRIILSINKLKPWRRCILGKGLLERLAVSRVFLSDGILCLLSEICRCVSAGDRRLALPMREVAAVRVASEFCTEDQRQSPRARNPAMTKHRGGIFTLAARLFAAIPPQITQKTRRYNSAPPSLSIFIRNRIAAMRPDL